MEFLRTKNAAAPEAQAPRIVRADRDARAILDAYRAKQALQTRTGEATPYAIVSAHDALAARRACAIAPGSVERGRLVPRSLAAQAKVAEREFALGI
ncbi:MAG: hypothetical protein N3A02_00295 [Rectinema sp.]|nr:hypothetical protein [Rectinema sp.]